MLYYQETTIVRVGVVSYIMLFFMINLFLTAFGIVYILELQSKILTTNNENIKLLDGMHEGVLILSKNN